MEQLFYKGRLKNKYAIQTIVPDRDDRTIVHEIIFNELCLGKIKTGSRNEFLKIITGLHRKGAQDVILGCTEIALLVQESHTAVPLLDTTRIHTEQALNWALA
jgi:aspartate racemase